MKAVLYDRFGSADVLLLGELPAPVPQAGQIVVGIHATSVNVIDARVRAGLMGPLVNRKFPKIPGADFAGLVLATAPDVRDFKVGDAVYGATDPFRGGALAEAVAVPAQQVAPKPPSLSFEQAAAMPIAGLAALLSVRDLGRLQPGDALLIHGASGGVGLFAIQIAKHLGAQVTAVAGTASLPAVRAAGADVIVDYQVSGGLDFAERFDVILNASGKMPYGIGQRFLKPDGRLIEPSPTIPLFIGAHVANLFRRRKHLMLQTAARTQDLAYLTSLVEAGKLQVTIAKAYAIADFQRALADQARGGLVGKVVITVQESRA